MAFFGKFKILSCNSNTRLQLKRRIVFCKGKKKKSPYILVRPSSNDVPCIVNEMWDHYYPFEPTTVSLGLGRKYNTIFDEQAQQALAEGLSLVAKCRSSGKIIGTCINKTACPWDADMLNEFGCSLSCPITKELYKFYAYVQKAPCLFKKYCTNKIFEISQVYVDRDECRKGIGKALVYASRQLGADCGYRVIRVDATSFYTAKICDALKFKLVHEIPYCSYTGQGPAPAPLFKPAPPHTSLKIYVYTPFAVNKKFCR